MADAIIAKAVYDYRNALRGHGYQKKKPEYVITECEKFFRSEWYAALSGTDGEVLIEKLKKELQQ